VIGALARVLVSAVLAAVIGLAAAASASATGTVTVPGARLRVQHSTVDTLGNRARLPVRRLRLR